MKRLALADRWFLLSMLALAATGSVLLADARTSAGGANALEHHGARFYWEAAFDAVSAACGVGLLQRDFAEGYTSHGRWVLTAIGAAGAFLYLAAALHVARRLRARAVGGRLPHPIGIVCLAGAVEFVLVVLVWLIGRATGTTGGLETAAQNTISAFSSLGWTSVARDAATGRLLAVIAFIGAVGWPLWILALPGFRRRFVHLPSVLGAAGGYVSILVIFAVLIAWFESPAQGGRGGAGTAALGQETRPLPRLVRALTQTTAASGAGIPTETFADRAVAESTKVALTGVLAIGGMGGSAGGGLKWPLLVWIAAGGAWIFGGRRGRTLHAGTLRCVNAATVCGIALVTLILVVAVGLLQIERSTASPLQPRHSFADACLDAASAVCGANLSTGLAGTVTDQNLSSGGREAVDQYQYGMVWLMLAMLAGRVLPLFVLRRMADLEPTDAPAGVSPLI